MKRIISILIAIVLCFSFAACGTDEPTKEVTSNNNSQKKQEQTFGLNETAVFSNLKFTATELKESAGTDFFKPESGNIFVGINFTIENTSDEEQTVSTLMLFEGYADDIKCDYSFSATCAFDEGTLDGTIAPGKKLVGWYAVEIPSTWKTLELNVQSDWLSNSSAKFVFTK